MEIARIDHLVLTVTDIDATATFYSHLGFRPVTFGGGRVGLQLGEQKINLHLKDHEFQPAARRPTPGSADICLLLATPLEAALVDLASAGITVENGPVDRTGALGPIRSVYVRDPDGNLVELSEPTGSRQ
jgi:catechol 2,3-dioxygenase-like lactoylglutathione lyase family enzyme